MVATVVTLGSMLAVAHLATLLRASKTGSSVLRVYEDREQMLALRSWASEPDTGSAERDPVHG